MANCCYERYVLLNPHIKCCFRYRKPICLEFTYFLCQIIAVIFLIWGKIKIPWEIYKKRDSDVIDSDFDFNRPYLKVFYTIGFITGIIKLAFFFNYFNFKIN